MSTCAKCGGTGWTTVILRNGVSAVKACECRKPAPVPEGQPLTMEIAGVLTIALCEALDRAPESARARAIIAQSIYGMFHTTEQLEWAIKRTCDLYTKWPGLPGIRQVLSSRYTPKDGVTLDYSRDYPDGIPAEKPNLQIEPKRQALPAGSVTSANRELDRAVVNGAARLGPVAAPVTRPAPPPKRKLTPTPPVLVVAEPERCTKCRGTGKLPDDDYCNCPLGADLARIERGRFTA